MSALNRDDILRAVSRSMHMEKLFSRILVPVNFNRNTEMAIQKAIQVANEFNCDVHLLHVQTPLNVIPFLYDGTVSGTWFQPSVENTTGRLEQLAADHKSFLNEGLLMTTEVLRGNWQQMIREVVIVRHIDLVLIPRYHRRFHGALVQLININRLSQQTGCPVLTVTRNFDICQLCNIVVPVTDTVPFRKLVVATYFARKFNGIIHLLGLNRSAGGEIRSSRSMMRSYQLLRDYSSVRVHCSTHDENEGGSGTLAFAKNVQADLIVVNPGKESVGRGFLGRWLGKFLFRESPIPVLTISQNQ